MLLLFNTVFLVKSRSSNMSFISVRGVFYLNIVVSMASAVKLCIKFIMFTASKCRAKKFHYNATKNIGTTF